MPPIFAFQEFERERGAREGLTPHQIDVQREALTALSLEHLSEQEFSECFGGHSQSQRQCLVTGISRVVDSKI